MLNKQLRQKILKIASTDQKLRKLAMRDIRNKKLAKRVYDCDKKNTIEVKKIIKEYGWPNFDLIGKKASNALWLLTQHADEDLKFQKKCLKRLEKAAINKQVHPKNLAYLTDRILVSEGKNQKFGTQYYKNKKGLWELWPVQKSTTDKERAQFNIMSLVEAKNRAKELNKKFAKFTKQ
ncbi:MAG: hypothetical protein HYW78_00565 [Parcubacteria group bacterium]|nr:hypothetical protein [Parcubacteria group bacterium]